LNNIQDDFDETQDAACFNSVLYHITAYLGLHHVYIHQYEKANAYLETAINGLGDEKSRVERAQAMVMLAAIKHVNEQFQSAAELGVQSREIFREAGDEWWYVLAGINLATTYYSMGELAEAEALYQEASRLVKPGDLRLKIPLTIGSAYTLFLHNDFDKAEQLLLDTMPLCDNTLDILWYSRILYYLGLVAYATQRVELAESYFHKCIELQKEYGEHSILAAATLHLGNCYAARGDRETARQQSRQVMRIGQEFNQFHLVYYALVFTARTYMVEGKKEQALEIYLLLNRCPVEYKGMQYEYALLQTELQAALSEGKMETELKQLDGEVSFDQARADVLKYVQEHESG
jgi:tetratricopeptide (TPR) repeat protein